MRSDTPENKSYLKRLVTIFPDAIVVNNSLDIKAVSSAVVDTLKYTEVELLGNSINILAYESALSSLIEGSRQSGIIAPIHTQLKAGCGRIIDVSLSGFDLRLLNDDRDFIIIKVRSMEELQLANSRLKQKTEQLESFLYHASHDLRGPIATIRGLVNVSKIRKDEGEVDMLFDLIGRHAAKLDQLLKSLSAFVPPDNHSI